MAQAGNLFLIQSDPTKNFTITLAQNAGDNQNIALPPALLPHGRCRIKSLAIVSKDNLAWELGFFGSSQFDVGASSLTVIAGPAAPTLGQPAGGQPLQVYESFRGKWAFITTNGVQYAGAGLWYYYIDGLDIPYQDEDWNQYGGAPALPYPGPAAGGLANPAYVPALHVKLTNRSVGAKTAGIDTFLLRVFAELTAGS